MSIDTLKKSAKKLHKALQEGKELTLMQVQHHLAQSHGYDSWEAALKANPERYATISGDGDLVHRKGLSDEEWEDLLEHVNVARLDPDYVVFTNFEVNITENPELQSRVRCFPRASPQELDEMRRDHELSCKAVSSPKSKAKIYSQFYNQDALVAAAISLDTEVPLSEIDLRPYESELPKSRAGISKWSISANQGKAVHGQSYTYHAYREDENDVLHLVGLSPGLPPKVFLLEVPQYRTHALAEALREGKEGSFERYDRLVLSGEGHFKYRSNRKEPYEDGQWSPEEAKTIADLLENAQYNR